MSAEALARDRAARRLAQVRFDRPVVLEAGAGTGKTTALVGRLLAWTLGAGWDETASARPETDDEALAGALLDGVVAITFTELAAAEMAARTQRELARLADGEPLEPWLVPEALPPEGALRERRARALLASIDRLRVQTIHSFALSLLRAYALDGGLHPALAVDADRRQLGEIVLDVLADRLPPLYQRGDPRLELLARSGCGPEALRSALEALNGLGLDATSLTLDPWRPEALRGALAPAAAATRRIAEALAGASLPTNAKNSIEAARTLPALARALATTPPTRAGFVALAASLPELAPSGARKRLGEWRKGGFNKAEEAHFGAASAEITGAARRLHSALALLERLDSERLDAAREVLAPLAAEVEGRMRARGAATFSDLLRLAADLLANDRVASDARRGIRQLLIDELQDTDELQCEIVTRLALEGPPGERPGLFLVGDPKQSIYGWRRARLATYLEFVDRALQGERAEPLVANFRSHEGILAEVERAVAPVMRVASEVAVPYARLVATGEREGAAAEVEYWAAWDPATGKPLRSGESARREAAAIADDLERRIEAGLVEPRDAALLLRSTTSIDRYLEALRERGIPFAVEKDRSYFRRRETIDAAALVRTLLDPTDLPALVGWLRSPWVGVPDAALSPLFAAGVPEQLTRLTGPDTRALSALESAIERAARATPSDADPDLAALAAWPTALSAAARSLAERRGAFHRESAELWVDGLRAAFRPELVAAARFQGRYRLANLDRFFRELAERLSGDEPTHRLLSELRAAVRERPDEPESRPLEGAGNAVRVMTIHRAKGLEFEEVYLAGAHHQPRAASAAPSVEAERVGDAWEYRLFGVPTPGLAPAADVAERLRAAEQVRLLYVALTRAKRRLVVTGALPANSGDAEPETARSLGDLLAPRIPAGEILRRVAESGESGSRDATGALWRILPVPPALSPRATPAPAPAVAAAEAPEAALARLAALREAARERQARPRVARMSEVARQVAESAGDAEGAADAGDPEVDRTRRIALARGIALHKALELERSAGEDPERWRAEVRELFRRELRGPSAAEGAAFDADLERLAASRLFALLGELGPRVVARELPLVARARGDSIDVPVEAVTGTIDLVYRDPASGAPVVADFKSDAVDDEGVHALVVRYAPQLDLYARSVSDALGLAIPPRRELWLLALDRVVPLD